MGVVFNIQRFSIHDGPGIRTTIFLKGCNNNCLWCHNPESLDIKPQMQVYFDKCIGCGKCFEVCPNACHQIMIDENNIAKRNFLRDKCKGCGLCSKECYAGGLVLAGEEMTSDYIVSEVVKDSIYYGDDGGATISGGEPFLQQEFLMELLKKLKENNINITIQTALNVPFERIEEAAPYVDLFMCDFKIFDRELHKKYIGNHGNLIRENTAKIFKLGKNVVIRTPVIGGVNNNEAEIENIASFVSSCGQPLYYELMPYHKLGVSKLEPLGMKESESFYTPSKEEMKSLANVAEKYFDEVRY